MSKKPITINSKEHFDRIVKATTLVVADFYADWCAPCKQIAPHFERLSESLSQENVVAFVKVNNDNQQELVAEYGVTAIPTFIILQKGKVVEKVQGANPVQLGQVLTKLVSEMENVLGSGAGEGSSGGVWEGAEIPRGYRDVSDQIEVRGCELLNADDGAGPVRVLFENRRPSGKAKDTSADWVQSGADDQLLLYIPFQSTVKLHTLQLTSVIPKDAEDPPSRPTVIRLFLNRTSNIDFDEADDAEPTQEIEIEESEWNSENTVSLPLRYVKFQKTTSLIVYVQKGDGEAETVRLDRIKLIGDAGPTREMGKLQKIGDGDE